MERVIESFGNPNIGTRHVEYFRQTNGSGSPK